jgi:DNA polymerase alpha-associated DNA helicase A
VERFGDLTTRMLDTQYRMHELIMQFSSKTLYGGKLKAHESVASHLLCQVPSVVAKRHKSGETETSQAEDENDDEDDDILKSALVFFDTARCGLDESEDEESSSRF